MLWAAEAVEDYDPSSKLKDIGASLLSINFADGAVNPAELKVVEQSIKTLPNETSVLIDADNGSQDHFTYVTSKYWARLCPAVHEFASAPRTYSPCSI